MRTLKRTLCLVLALVMVLGLGVTNAFALTADDFTDLKDAQHEEAIRVLTAIGVISGNGDGTLTPTATLTRGQMAVIITKLMGGLGNKFIPSSSFSDVKGHYAERYIAFCEANNIVRGDIGAGGTYRPDDPVTGYQLGVMLLSVMGYNMDYEVKGKDWQAVTYKYVTRNSLDAGLSLEYDYDAAIPRDDAFQLCFNTLQATMVSYDSNTSVSGPGFEWTVTSDAEQVDRTESDATAVKNYAGDNGDGFGTLQVCEKYYPTLTVTRGRDAFKRPGNTWSRNNVPVADVPDTPIKTYDGNFTGKDAKALSANGKVVLDQGANGVDVYYNGGAVNDTNTIQFKQDNALGAAPGAVSNGLWLSDAIGVPGYEVEVYKHVAGDTGTNDNVKYDIIVREAYVGQISLIGTTPKDITVSVYEHGRVAAGGAVTLKVKAGGPATDADEHYNELAKYELGDYIAVYAKPGFEDTNLYTDASGVGGQTKTAGSTAVYDNAADAIAEIAPLSAEKVTIQRIDDNGKNVNSTVTTTAGTKYKINCAAVHAKGANVDNAKGAFATIENFTWAPSRNFNVGPATLYTFNGNVMIIDNSNGVTVVNKGYAYLYDWRDGSGDGDIKWESEGGNTTGTGASWVRMLTADGEYIEAPVADDSDAAIDNTALGTLVHYTYNKLNKDYTLKQICTDFSSDPTDQTNDAPGYAAGTSNKLSITSKKSEGTVPGSSTATKVAFDSGTKFIVVTTTPASGRIKKDWKTTANVYDIYDVPNISADSAKTFVTAAKVLDTNGDLQDAVTSGSNLVTGVTDKVGVVLIIDAQSTVTADGYYFVLGTGKETKTRVLIDEDENVYYEYITYKAVVDGELTTVDVKVEDTRKAPGVTYPTALNNDEIKFVKNPIKDADDCIVGWGIEVDYTGQNGHVTDTNVIYDGTQVSEVEKDHITITASSTTNGDQEDYLASVAVGSVAYKYNAKDGVLEKVALKDIVATSTGSADNSDYHYAVRDKDHTTVYMLFIKVADKP